MSKDSNIDDILAHVQSVDADDPEMIAKLNEIALKVAERQGKIPTKATSPTIQVASDPMDELGCEGCQ